MLGCLIILAYISGFMRLIFSTVFDSYGAPSVTKLNCVIRICDQVRFNPACSAKVTSYDIQISPEVGLTVDTTKRANKNGAGLNVMICRLICAFGDRMWQNQESRINLT